jgi:hypothetical protein
MMSGDAIGTKPAKPKWIPPRAGMGRPKGAKNKFSVSIKDQMLKSLEKLGGVDYLVWLGRECPAVYGGLLGRVIPMQIAGHNGGPITFTVITGVERADDVPTIEHEAPVATIEAKPEPMPPPVQEPAPAAPAPRPYMSPPRATAAPEPPQERPEPVRSARRALGAPWT